MRIERDIGDSGASPLGAIFGVVCIVTFGLAVMWLHMGFPQPVCGFHALTGLPCPSCGSSRMIAALVQGRVAEAFMWNPLAFAGVLAVAVWATASTLRLLFSLPVWRVVLESGEALAIRIAAVMLIAGNWIYLIWRGV